MQKIAQPIIEPVRKDPLRHLPGYTLRRASAAMMARIAKELAPLELRPTEASVLLVLEANPAASQSDIGRILGIQRANMAPLAAQLEARGLIRRDRANGRTQSMSLTESGTTTTAKVWQIIRAVEEKALDKIPPAHRESFLIALQSLWDDAE